MNLMKRTWLCILPIVTLSMTVMPLSASAESGTLDNYTWTIEDNILTLHGDTFDVVYDSAEILVTGTEYTGITISEEMLAKEENQPLSDYLANFAEDRFFTLLTVCFDVEKISDGTVPVNEIVELVELTDKVTEIENSALASFSETPLILVDSKTLSLDGTEIGISSASAGWDLEDGNGVLHGYVNTPAEAYAKQIGFTFVSLEGSGSLGDSDMLSWNIADNTLTINANDDSCKIEYLPNEVLVTGSSFALSKEWHDFNDIAETAPLMYFWDKWNRDGVKDDTWVFDVATIDSPYACYGFETISKLELTENVQNICLGGLYLFENVTDVYVASESLDLNDSLLGCDGRGEPINEHLTIHGYTGSLAQLYAEEKNFTFVALDEPEETTESTTEATSEITPEETSTPETTTSTVNTTSTTTATSSIPEATTSIVNTTSNTKTNTTVSSGTSSPKTGEGGIATIIVTSVTALLGSLVCRKKK